MAQRVTGSPDEPWPVGRLATELRGYIGRLGQVWVEGELTGWNESRGSVFGKLKDAETDATVSINLWSSAVRGLKEPFQRGDRVVALVQPDYWVKAGTLSMNVATMRHVGIGDLLARLEALKGQLRSEGLFDESRKRRLPFLPTVVGLVTGRESDAEKDVLRNAQLRWPGVRFRVEHAAVQGEQTVPTVLRALATLEADPEVEVIVVARGGGDFQNLLGFSDERLLRAVAALETPIVSAIGHEADSPLLDLVADLRASTPTDAAKRVVPDVGEELARIAQARAMMRGRLTQLVQREIASLEQLRSRPSLASPHALLEAREQDVARLALRADELMERAIERSEHALSGLRMQVRALSPQSTLDRGYAVVQTPSGGVARDAAEVTIGDAVLVTLAAGSLEADVTSATPEA